MTLTKAALTFIALPAALGALAGLFFYILTGETFP
jgi:hypothetical protein